MALGTDTSGSIRLPSCWCGIVGLKPTFGLVPFTGIMGMDECLDHVGPMARSVYDCALLLEVSYCSNLAYNHLTAPTDCFKMNVACLSINVELTTKALLICHLLAI